MQTEVWGQMVRIAICDDEKDELVRTKSHCVAYSAKHPEYGIKVSLFDDGETLLSHLEGKATFDLLILDIYMPKLTGMDLARVLREQEYCGEIIFLTTSEAHAVEAFALNATHYIVKPYTEDLFHAALDKAFALLEKRKTAKITVQSSRGMHTILFEHFLYAETDKHTQIIHMADTKCVRIRMSSTELYETIAQDERFFKYGSTYILNLEKIQEITARTIVLDNGVQLQMQRRQYKNLTERYTQYSVKGWR